MAFLPLIVAAAGAAAQYGSQASAAKYNSQAMKLEQNASINQGNAQANQVSRAGRAQMGKQEAAFGASGVGYGGSSETALDTSAVNDEMDVLNTRYKGNFTGYGYGVQSNLDNQQSSQYSQLAGMALLKGVGSNYSYAPAQPSAASTSWGSQAAVSANSTGFLG